MMDLALGTVMLYAAFSLGRRVLSWMRLPVEDDECLAYGVALGLGLLGFAVLILGLASFLTAASLWMLSGLAAALSLLDVKASLRTLRQAGKLWDMPLTGWMTAVFALAAVSTGAVLLGVLAPETANDSLCYHVHLPKIFLATHRVGPVPYEINSHFPMLMEMLYTLGLGLGGMALAKFFHLATGLTAALAILVFVRRQAGVSWAWVGSLLFLTTPVVVNEMGTTYVDVGLACYSLVGLLAALRWCETKHTGWLILAGIFAGLTLSVKYLGVVSWLGIFLIILWEILRSGMNFRKAVGSIVLFSVFTALVSFYWYLRAYLEFGNPVYPYFYSLFKSGDPGIHYDDIGVPKTVASFLLLPWTVTMHPERFEGFGVALGPAYLAFLPSLGISAVPFSLAGHLLAFAFFYASCWFFLGQSLRFFLPVVPVLGILVSMGLARLRLDSFGEKLLRLLIILIFLLHAAIAVYHYRDEGRVALRLEREDDYLRRVERSYEVSEYVNSNLPRGAKILASDETHLYYFERTIVREVIYARWRGYFKEAGSAEEVFRLLRKEGFTHILLTEGRGGQDNLDAMPPLRIPVLLARPQNELARFLDPIYTKQFKSPKEAEPIRYTLYYIKSAQQNPDESENP